MSSYLGHPAPHPGLPAPITPDELRAWLEETRVDVPERDQPRLLAALQPQRATLRAAGLAQRATMLRARHEAMVRAAALPGGRPALRRVTPGDALAGEEEPASPGLAMGCLRRIAALYAAGLAALLGLVVLLTASKSDGRALAVVPFALALLLVIAAATGRGLDRARDDRGVVATFAMLALAAVGLLLLLGGLALMGAFLRDFRAGRAGFHDPDFGVPAVMLVAAMALGLDLLARIRRRGR